VQLALAGRNLFLTGGAGVGKSRATEEIVMQLREQGKMVRGRAA
jgi:putative protein kinase ArgK-like GTPase of G3E family